MGASVFTNLEGSDCAHSTSNTKEHIYTGFYNTHRCLHSNCTSCGGGYFTSRDPREP